MKEDEFDEDTMIVKFYCDHDGGLKISTGYHFSEDMPDDTRGGYLTLLHGLMAALDVEPEIFLRASMYAEFGADVERKMSERSVSKSDKPNLSVVDCKGRIQ
jgi:hypothetical protein